MKAVVIGAGAAGLTAAAALAQAMVVLEQYERPGGVTAAFEQDGFHWDLGQLMVEGFGPQDPAGSALASLGVLQHIQAQAGERGYIFPDFDPSPWLHGPCTYVYGSYDLEGEIADAHQGIYHQGRAGFVIHVPSLHSPSMAPAGQHAMTIYTICPDRLKEDGWAEQREASADQLVACAEKRIPGLSRHVRTRAVITPDDFRARTAADHHAFGGIAPILGAWQAPHQTPIPGLWFIGAQSQSGGGVSAVISGAYKTALKIIAGQG